MDRLVRIKRLIVRGALRFSEKERLELERDGLEPEEAMEASLSTQMVTRRSIDSPRFAGVSRVVAEQLRFASLGEIAQLIDRR